MVSWRGGAREMRGGPGRGARQQCSVARGAAAPTPATAAAVLGLRARRLQRAIAGRHAEPSGPSGTPTSRRQKSSRPSLWSQRAFSGVGLAG